MNIVNINESKCKGKWTGEQGENKFVINHLIDPFYSSPNLAEALFTTVLFPPYKKFSLTSKSLVTVNIDILMILNFRNEFVCKQRDKDNQTIGLKILSY